jgi:CheY-like chemotaxis protein
MREPDDDRRSERMTVLALESEPAQAATIRHVVCDLVRAELTLVKSVAHALQVLHTQRPDLILLPMFVAPAEEAQLLAFLRALPSGAHIETQITPILGPPDATVTRVGWGRWRARPTPIDSTSAAERHFAERLSWALEQRREQLRADRCRLPYDDTVAVDTAPPPLSAVESSSRAPECVATDAADTLALPLDEVSDTNRVAPAGNGQIDGLHEDRRAHIVTSGHHDRRQHVRVDGPFDGCRHGVFDMPILIHNLSESGCFVDSLQVVEPGRQLSLGVQPSGEGWITVKAEVVRGWPGFGFAVRFVDMPDVVRAGLARLVASRAE